MQAFNIQLPPSHFVCLQQDAEQWLDYYMQSRFVNNGLGLDTETTGINNMRSYPIIWSLSDVNTRICLTAELLPIFRPLLESPQTNFDISNAKFDAHMLANRGIDITKAGELRDTSVMSWLHDENKQGRHGLKENIFAWFGWMPPTFAEIFGKNIKKKGEEKKTEGELIYTALADPEKVVPATDYASIDAYNHTTLRIKYDEVLEEIELYSGMTAKRFFYTVCVPFTKVLFSMERTGFNIDLAHLDAIAPGMLKEIESIEKEFGKAAGQIINLNSTDQLRTLFFDKLGYTPIEYTSGGASGIKKPSLDKDTLETWAGMGDPLSNILMRHRKLSKIHSTYVKGMRDIVADDGRMHTTLNQHGTVTGRLSSSKPNLQNIPRPGGDEFKIRKAFIASIAMRLLVADYAQLEMRLMAHFSKDRKMIQAIIDGVDIHCLTVAEMSNGRVSYEEVVAAKTADDAIKSGKLNRELTSTERDLLQRRQGAKAVGFGIIYGIGGRLLAANLTKESKGAVVYSERDGFDLIDQWFNVFPGVFEFIEYDKKMINKVGYVQTVMGRFRRFGDVRTMRKRERALAERQGVNARIQGSAADIAMMAMLKCFWDSTLNEVGCRLLLQIHDELIFEIPDDDSVCETASERIKLHMENPFDQPLLVPLPVSPVSGYNWAECH